MGMRKKKNQQIAKERIVARFTRAKKAIKRAAKAKTAGQKLHDAMHGKS